MHLKLGIVASNEPMLPRNDSEIEKGKKVEDEKDLVESYSSTTSEMPVVSHPFDKASVVAE